MSNVFAYFLVISNVTSTIDITLIFSLALATMCVCVLGLVRRLFSHRVQH